MNPLFSYANYLAMQALAAERIKDWQDRIDKMKQINAPALIKKGLDKAMRGIKGGLGYN